MRELSLKELNGEIKGNYLRFDCPACGFNHSIRIRIGIKGSDSQVPSRIGEEYIWAVKNTDMPHLDNLTLYPDILTRRMSLSPSINCTPDCKFHGWVENGNVKW